MAVLPTSSFTSIQQILLLSLIFTTTSAASTRFNRSECAEIARARALSNTTGSPFLVTANGSLTSNLSEAWGITYQACVELCGDDFAAFDWISFTTLISSWLLPWLALTAQLPFETKDIWGNVMAFFLAVGSPMLITYSLLITVLNAR